MLTCRVASCGRYRVNARGFSDFLEWEELKPSSATSMETDEEPVEEKKRSFYVPPPFSDAELILMSPERIKEWPKSRVVWALGRFGFSKAIRNDSRSSDVAELLVARSLALIDSLNTRDIVRILQAVAYGPQIGSDSVFQFRRKICSRIESVNDLYFVSLLFGHVKLLGRLDWTMTPNCLKTSQFFLSELIYRKSKIDATRFIEITTALASNEHMVKAHGDSVQMILGHGIGESLKHVRDAAVLKAFGKSLCGVVGANQTFFVALNETLCKKFERQWKCGKDALEIGFYFFLNEMMTNKSFSDWLTCVQAASESLPIADPETRHMMSLVRIVIDQRNLSPFLTEDVLDWIKTFPDPGSMELVETESRHVGSVIRRMVQGSVASGIGPVFIPPFNLSAANEEEKFSIEWLDQCELEPPYRRGTARIFSLIKRSFLESQGWTLILLSRNDFKVHTSDNSESLLDMNRKFKSVLKDQRGIEWLEEVKLSTAETTGPTIDVREVDLGPRKNRRESKSRAYRIRSRLQMISRQYRKQNARK